MRTLVCNRRSHLHSLRTLIYPTTLPDPALYPTISLINPFDDFAKGSVDPSSFVIQTFALPVGHEFEGGLQYAVVNPPLPLCHRDQELLALDSLWEVKLPVPLTNSWWNWYKCRLRCLWLNHWR